MLKGVCLSKKAIGETELDSYLAALPRQLLSNALRLPLLLNPLRWRVARPSRGVQTPVFIQHEMR